MKIVIFDLDETLGYFIEFGMLWYSINKYLKLHDISETLNFNYLLDLYPEFLRPNIVAILNYLKHKKKEKFCNKMMIYTNNQGTDSWASKLINYFDNKIKVKLFDNIISAFKINGKRMEICRTSHDKSYHDLIKCTKIPLSAQICYLDDTYYPEMSHKNIYYIHVKPYIHDLPFDEMINRFIMSGLGNNWIKEDFSSFIMNSLESFNYSYIKKTKEEEDIDKIISKEIMINLQYFFKSTNKQCTIKKKRKNANKTRKN
jgi:hypothetical protein